MSTRLDSKCFNDFVAGLYKVPYSPPPPGGSFSKGEDRREEKEGKRKKKGRKGGEKYKNYKFQRYG